MEGVEEGTQILAGQVELPSGVTLISDPDMLVVNVVAAPTAEDLEAEGGGESVEEQAAEGEGTAEATADGESAQSESAQSE